MIALEPHEEGTVLPVKAQPGAKRNELRGDHHGQLKVCVTQVAEKGKANKALLAVLCKELGLRRSQVELLSGQTSAQKRILVRGATPEALRATLELKIGEA